MVFSGQSKRQVILLLLSLVTGQILAASAVNEDKFQSAQGLAAHTENMLGGMDLQSLMRDFMANGYQENMKKAAELRQKYLQVMPEKLSEQITDVKKAYLSLAKAIKLETCFQEQSTKLHALVTKQLSDEQPLKATVIASLERMNRALADGSLLELITPQQFNPYDVQNILMTFLRMQKQDTSGAEAFTLESLRLLITQFSQLMVYAEQQGATHDELAASADLLTKLLKHAANKEMAELCHVCVASIREQMAATFISLNGIIGELANQRIRLPEDADAVIREALDFWLKEFKTHRETLKSFLSMVSTAKVDLSVVLRSMSRIYDFASDFFLFGYHDIWAKSNLIDAGFRCSMVGVAFAHRRGEAARNEMQQYITGGASLSDFVNPMDAWEYQAMLATTSLIVGLNPKALSPGMHALSKTMWRIIGALAIYHLTNRNDANRALWPKDDEWLRNVLVLSLKTGQLYISSEVMGLVSKHIDPVTLEAIEKYSMGLIKPELIDVALETLFPMLLYTKNRQLNYLADFTTGDFLNYGNFWLNRQLREDFDKAEGQAGSWNLNTNKQKYQNYLNGKLGFYIEYNIAQYLFSSVGTYWGKFIGKRYSAPIQNGVYSGLKRVGQWIAGSDDDKKSEEPGDVEEAAERLAAERPEQETQFQKDLLLLKSLVVSLFEEESQPRMVVISFLKNYGLLAESLQDNKSINFGIISLVLHYVTKIKFLTHTEAAKLLKEYLKHETKVEPFIDIMIDTIKSNATASVGGILGGVIGAFVGKAVMWNHGPFVLKNA